MPREKIPMGWELMSDLANIYDRFGQQGQSTTNSPMNSKALRGDLSPPVRRT